VTVVLVGLGWSVVLFFGSESRSRHFQGILKGFMIIGDGKGRSVDEGKVGKQDDEQCYVVTTLSLSRKNISLQLRVENKWILFNKRYVECVFKVNFCYKN
jgi:hypothetical protein